MPRLVMGGHIYIHISSEEIGVRMECGIYVQVLLNCDI